MLSQGIKGDIRPPKQAGDARKRLLVYGSSDHGGNASVPSGTYAFRLARKLGYDLINLGCAGSCQMDEAMAQL
ncbi:MAG: SGNH/GDSL hydrolase family protein [Enterocloster bolteae]